MSKRFRRLSHTIYECKYHLIFCPKYRRRILKDEIREYARREIENLLRQKEGIEIIQMNVQSDHIHFSVKIRFCIKNYRELKIYRNYSKAIGNFWLNI